MPASVVVASATTEGMSRLRAMVSASVANRAASSSLPCTSSARAWTPRSLARSLLGSSSTSSTASAVAASASSACSVSKVATA